jgi:flavin-dependent dehydrogenase
MLLRHSEKSGATVKEGALVLRHEVSGEIATVTYRDENGDETVTSAKFLMDASGIAAFTAKRENIHRLREGHRKVALFGHFENVIMPDCEEEGDIVLVVRERSWCWMIPLSKTRTSVGIVVDQAEFASAKKSPEAMFDEIVASTPELRRRMSGAEIGTKVHVISDYSFEVDRMVSDRLIRIGDAAGFMDPIFSSGVMLAMQLGRDGARCVLEALGREAAFVPSMYGYEKKARVAMGRFWDFIERYYTRPFIDLFLQPNPKWQMTSAINAVLAGRPDMPWRVRWRLWVFFMLVRFQRFYPLVKRIDWSVRVPAQAT